ncbi:hypothetical protein [Pseudomonas putida]|uniref:Uncharacterized protein n=1 Tax=Pseudomonas putida TaxID=303 RepID=A0A2S3WFE6_PSEPU|nr:hypothetical protein [Pseudomonas putida]POF89660.1 hypothetical protein BGP80_17495 [Pseudomonas putida]
MDTNKMRDISREQFEKFALSSEGGLFAGHLAKGEDGEYLNYSAQCYWLFWQASREAVAVEIEQIRSEAKRQEDGLKEMLRRQNKQICALRGKP